MSWAGPLLLVELCARASAASPFNPFSPWISNLYWFQGENEEARQVLLDHLKLKDPTEKGSSRHTKEKSFEPWPYPFRDLRHEPFLRATPVLNGVNTLQNAQKNPIPAPWLTCQEDTTSIWKELEKKKGAAQLCTTNTSIAELCSHCHHKAHVLLEWLAPAAIADMPPEGGFRNMSQHISICMYGSRVWRAPDEIWAILALL